jgi:hypothetical protein
LECSNEFKSGQHVVATIAADAPLVMPKEESTITETCAGCGLVMFVGTMKTRQRLI